MISKDNGATITYATSRFLYTYDKASQTGTGYMDVLLDEQNVKGARKLIGLFCLLKTKTVANCKEK
ncbi:hypothetical protein SFC43_16120 [Bacteroides sp. CR5/BHMF/2]|nr:hypothetical protein [Bacteroides sp. CR5/BHMF/2]